MQLELFSKKDPAYSLNAYQNHAMQFRLPTADETYCLYNLAGECGEVMSLVAKARRDGRKLDFQEELKKELGDVLWQVAAIALDNGFTLESIAATNILKLTKRREKNALKGSGDSR